MVWKQVPLDEEADLRDYDFAVKTDMKLVPRTDLPAGVQSSGPIFPDIELLGLQVKRGGKWTSPDMSQARNRRLTISTRSSGRLDSYTASQTTRKNIELLRDSEREMTLQIQLGNDPGNAQEMRLKCRLLGSYRYNGQWPKGVPLAQTMRRDIFGQPYENLVTPPFVLTVKAPFRARRLGIAALEGLAKPSPLKVVEARLAHFHHYDQLQFWVKSTRVTPRAKYVVWGATLTDVRGKPVPLIDRQGNKVSALSREWRQMGPQQSQGRRGFLNENGQIGPDEVVLFTFLNDVGPRGGWDRLKWPLRLTAKISDGVSKPIRFSGPLRDVEEYEPPLASQTPQPPTLAFRFSERIG
jgi:hypothetical protein